MSGTVQLPFTNTTSGKIIDTSELVVGANTVERERMVVGDDTAASGLAPVTSSGGLSVNITNVTTAVSLSSSPTVLTTGPLQVLTSGPLQVLTTGPLQVLSSGTYLVNVVGSSGVGGPVTSSGGIGVTILSGAGAGSTAVNIFGSSNAIAPATSSGGLLITFASTQPIVSASSGLVQIIMQSSLATSVFAYVSSSSTNQNSIQTGNSALFGYGIFNTTASPRFVHFYMASSGAPTVGTTAGFLMTVMAPGSTGGGGANLISPVPMAFSTKGLAFTITPNPETTSTGTIGASDIVLNVYYI